MVGTQFGTGDRVNKPTGRENLNVVCVKTQFLNLYHTIVVNKVTVVVKGPVQLLDIGLLLSQRILLQRAKFCGCFRGRDSDDSRHFVPGNSTG